MIKYNYLIAIKTKYKITARTQKCFHLDPNNTKNLDIKCSAALSFWYFTYKN